MKIWNFELELGALNFRFQNVSKIVKVAISSENYYEMRKRDNFPQHFIIFLGRELLNFF